MFAKQKGVLPMMLFIVGLIIHMVSIVFTIPYIVPEILQFFSTEPFLDASLTTIKFLAFMIGFVWSVPLLIGSFFVSAFPEIRVTEKGIEYRSYKFIRSFLKWSEIDGVVPLKKGYKALKISRKGFVLINGLYSNQIYGAVVKVKKPVILLSPKLENIDHLLREIDLHLKERANN